MTADCTRCGTHLRRWTCGCWLDRSLSRSCPAGESHQPGPAKDGGAAR